MNVQGNIIDVHSHILPDVDDGSRSLEESVKMLSMAAEQGIMTVIATPHYSRKRGSAGYQELFERLQERMDQELPDMRLYLGQETWYHESLVENLQQGNALTLAGSRFVLTEFDPAVCFQTLFQGIRRLSGAGYVPVLAHMERYRCLREPGHLEDLLGTDCRLQMNYESLEGHWYSPEIRWCRRQVLEGRIWLLGTDMHRTDYRPPQIREALGWLQGHLPERRLSALVMGHAQQILNSREK